MSSSSDPWWAAQAPQGGGYQSQQPDDSTLADAAADMRAAAEYLRDAATPPPPPKESNWDFTWFTGWVKRSDNGIACKRALWTIGPAWTVFLTLQRFPITTAFGITFLAFAIVGGWHLRVERKTTRLITWGLPIGLVYYTPVAIVFGLASFLVGG
ncbi:hypothetical protein ABZV75_38490 [Streptomyces flaveolus]|uniref:hypothetical protein n=1 Tax=Streptomyces flaveolus TaxID=67297 RepID=UPI0033AF06F2